MNPKTCNQTLSDEWPHRDPDLPPIQVLECHHNNPNLLEKWGFGDLATHIEQNSLCRKYLEGINQNTQSFGDYGYLEYSPGESEDEIQRSIGELFERERKEPAKDLSPGDLVATAAKVKTYHPKTGKTQFRWNFSPVLALLTEGPEELWKDDKLKVYRCWAVSKLNTQWAREWLSKSSPYLMPPTAGSVTQLPTCRFVIG